MWYGFTQFRQKAMICYYMVLFFEIAYLKREGKHKSEKNNVTKHQR